MKKWIEQPGMRLPCKRIVCSLSPDHYRFRRISPVIFICGGVNSKPRDTLRNYLRKQKGELQFFYAERVWELISSNPGLGSLKMEADLAALSDLVVIIVESPGTFAELGAFSHVEALSYRYKRYEIPKKAGGTRTILHPSKRLKALQRWLLANIIGGWPVHAAATAYRKGQTILDNAKVHARSKYLLRMDLENFFPSLKVQDMREYLKKRPGHFAGWTSEDIEGFYLLVFKDGQLTIGAPTSPGISNALCFDLDVAISVGTEDVQARCSTVTCLSFRLRCSRTAR